MTAAQFVHSNILATAYAVVDPLSTPIDRLL